MHDQKKKWNVTFNIFSPFIQFMTSSNMCTIPFSGPNFNFEYCHNIHVHYRGALHL